jgi:hypothetical protein
VGWWPAAAQEWWAEQKEKKEVGPAGRSGQKGGRVCVKFKRNLSWILSGFCP